jgi:hypothetical protein
MTNAVTLGPDTGDIDKPYIDHIKLNTLVGQGHAYAPSIRAEMGFAGIDQVVQLHLDLPVLIL